MKRFTKQKAEKRYRQSQKNFTENDLHKVLENSDSLKSKFRKQSKLVSFIDDFKVLFSMLKDYYKGNYKAVPWYIISSIGATLLYVLTPVDSIPDFIPIAGYIDDAAIFGICLNFVRSEVEKYRVWKEGTGQKTED